ncbi:MAG: hypothetical protein KatS3mg110_2140 [Pirellulaceae bacterium]|nr:MAG: hypothetical protein KatS3mg110_1915 [Pirellulaceae bacterium]GIW94099.1 MAG: hypothetical protein KatS3mg110_2140 [Pirellulaceae bacterium]
MNLILAPLLGKYPFADQRANLTEAPGFSVAFRVRKKATAIELLIDSSEPVPLDQSRGRQQD